MPPRVVVLGGVNGAGKTTAADELLKTLRIPVFTNADAIARGLNSRNPESVAFRAGRVMLEWMNDLALDKKDFAFETTLAARSYAAWLRKLKHSGYEVYLYYSWLRSPEIAIARIRQRVQAGGHHIPDSDVRRRYSRSARNFLEVYRDLADEWEVVDNTFADRRLIAIGSRMVTEVESSQTWSEFEGSARDV